MSGPLRGGGFFFTHTVYSLSHLGQIQLTMFAAALIFLMLYSSVSLQQSI